MRPILLLKTQTDEETKKISIVGKTYLSTVKIIRQGFNLNEVAPVVELIKIFYNIEYALALRWFLMKKSNQQAGKSAVDIDNEIHHLKLTFVSMLNVQIVEVETNLNLLYYNLSTIQNIY